MLMLCEDETHRKPQRDYAKMNLFITLQIIAFALFDFIQLRSSSCNFDMLYNSQDIQVQVVDYSFHRRKRKISKYAPLKFHLYFEEVHAKSLKDVLKSAAARISQLLYVIPVKGPLFLERFSCEKRWFQGPNKGRCASLGSRYKGEFCENKIDKFKIPELHLNKLEIFNFTGENATVSLPAGTGITDADYVLYVKNQYTNWCQQKDVLAYASYCRLDQHGRPIAGFINFCPHILTETHFDENYILNVAIHEMFHALGFSKDLFSSFCTHSIEQTCYERSKNIISKDVENMYRLILPSVVEQMRAHFNCSIDHFGAPLDMDETGTYGSHWDPYFMYGSIMSSNMIESQYVAIDSITLAVFADTGWYQVNYSAGDPYFWGKDGGCYFGFENTCSTTDGLCPLSEENITEPGCDFLHRTKSLCSQMGKKRPCGIYKPNVSNDCFFDMDGSSNDNTFDHQACFVVNTNDEIKTACMPYKCTSDDRLEIFVDEIWQQCSYNGFVKRKNASIVCPKSNTLCSHVRYKYESSILSFSSTAQKLLSNEIIIIVFMLIFFI